MFYIVNKVAYIAPRLTVLLTLPHIVIVVQLNGFISGSLLQQRPLYKPTTFHLDRILYCRDMQFWSLCIQNCAKWVLFLNPVTYRRHHLTTSVVVTVYNFSFVSVWKMNIPTWQHQNCRKVKVESVLTDSTLQSRKPEPLPQRRVGSGELHMSHWNAIKLDVNWYNSAVWMPTWLECEFA